jgi:precorrin-6B C5,15-methyltransferase / cobalt-precorrin-6B C5,C15-methyltransferase
MIPVWVVGMGMSPRDLAAEARERIESAEILAGGRRHLAAFPDHPAEKRVIDRNLRETIAWIGERMADRRVVVLASGDPLFFGVGPLIRRILGAEHVRFLPNVTAVGAAFARIGESWQDAETVSLHGRDGAAALAKALSRSAKIAVFTDPERHPGWIGEFLAGRGESDVRMCVLENLGDPAERVRWFAPAEAVGERFADPNLAILRRAEPPPPRPAPRFGSPESEFSREAGLITKAEVRAISLAKLRLNAPDLTLWDLGAGAGSVGIEAATFLPSGRVVAVEKDPDRIARIAENRERFGVRNLEIARADLPEGMDGLPSPDRVFAGGGGRNLPDILRAAGKRLRPGGIVVVNTVLLPNIAAAEETLRELGMDTETIQVQVNRGRDMPWGRRLEALNPVWIISGSSGRERHTFACSKNESGNGGISE